jgi:ketosteroid isomerase-like protein
MNWTRKEKSKIKKLISARWVGYSLALLLAIIGSPSCSTAHSDTWSLSATDRQEITDLIYSYSYTFDSKNLDAFLNLYTQDAVWEDYYAGASTPTDVLDTPEKMRQAFGNQIQQLSAEGIQSRHFLTNPAITGTSPGLAQGTVMFLVTHQKYDQPQDTASVEHTGMYSYQFAKTAAGWKFRRLEAHLDHN